MITREQIEMLVDMFGLEWVDHVESVEKGETNE